MSAQLEARAGVLAIITVANGVRVPVAECAGCEQVLPILARGLCSRCRSWHRTHGTIGDYGYVKADRMADYVRLRDSGWCDIGEAAARIGVSERTAERYEAELRDAGLAPWHEWEERRHAA